MSDPYPARPPGAGPPPSRRITRRRLLAGAVVLASGAAGVAIGLRPTARPGPQLPLRPPLLQAALDRERALISGLDQAAGADPALGRLLAPLRADHLAHAQAIEASLTGYAAATPSRTVTTSAGPEQAPTLAALRAAERAAGQAASTDSAALTGELAVLLGSIAACEAAHVELLA
jgi:hypothetical protein